MTYNVFGGTLNLTQSISFVLIVDSALRIIFLELYCIVLYSGVVNCSSASDVVDHSDAGDGVDGSGATWCLVS